MDFPFETFVWNIYGNQASIAGDLQAGNISWAHQLTNTNFEALERADGVQTHAAPNHGRTWFFINNKRELFQDAVLRRAMMHAIDKQQIVNIAAAGRGQIGWQIPPHMEFWHNSNVDQLQGGIEQARQMLRDAGYTWDNNGNLLRPVSRFEGDGPPGPYHQHIGLTPPSGWPEGLEYQG
jgi:peptide/nickel transport system substrate-binding protein